MGLKHLFLFLLAGATGGVAGALIQLLLRHGSLQPLEEIFWRNEMGAVIGGALALTLAGTIMVVSYARNAAIRPDGFYVSRRGIGSILIGKSDIAQDGSYCATEWLIVYDIPLFPIARYRVIKHPGTLWVRTTYTILDKSPPKLAAVVRTYAILLAVLLIVAVVGVLYWRR